MVKVTKKEVAKMINRNDKKEERKDEKKDRKDFEPKKRK